MRLRWAIHKLWCCLSLQYIFDDTYPTTLTYAICIDVPEWKYYLRRVISYRNVNLWNVVDIQRLQTVLISSGNRGYQMETFSMQVVTYKSFWLGHSSMNGTERSSGSGTDSGSINGSSSSSCSYSFISNKLQKWQCDMHSNTDKQ